jgi:hypothetical protein
MNRYFQVTSVLCLALATGLGIYGGYGLNKHLIVALDKWGDAGTEAQQTLSKVNGPHGTLVELDKAILAAKSLEVHADIVVAHEDKQLSTLDGYTKDLATGLSELVVNGTQVLVTSNAAVMATTNAVNTANETIQKLQPAEANAATSIADFDALLKNPSIPDTINNVDRLSLATAQGTEQLSGILSDTHKMTTKLEHDVDDPKPWYAKVLPMGTDVAKIAVCWFTKTCV